MCLQLFMAAGLCLLGCIYFMEWVTASDFWQKNLLSSTEQVVNEGEEHPGEANMDELLKAYQRYNADVVGLIRIPDSVLDHPLMQTREDEEYYLYRDLDRNYNSHGVPFLSRDSRMEGIGRNMVIYGHNIHLQTRDVFCDLACYEDLSYYRQHPLIETVSASGIRRWLIFAYFLADNADEDAFHYSDYTEFSSQEDFESFLREVEKRNWLDVNAGVVYGDSLITLSSCSNELAGSGTNRMVVMGKLLKEGEDCRLIVDGAEMAVNPLLPERLTAKNMKTDEKPRN